MDAADMYTRTVESLRRSIEQHRTPSGRASIKAFAEAYHYSRQNLVEVLGGHQELSVALFMRLAATLAGKQVEPLPAGVERWSLRTWLQMQSVPIHAAMYEVNFRDTGIVQNGKKTDF